MKYPNILIIVMDTVNASHLSCYGYSRKTTPNIDLLANEGVVFEQAVSTSSWTLPTHASILTGVYSSKHGAHNLHQQLDDTYITLPEYLNRLGYKTAAFSNNPYLSRETGLHRGFQDFEELWLEKGLAHQAANFRKLLLKAMGKSDKGALEINKRIYKWLNENTKANQPFFIFINYLEPHLPYLPPKPFSDIYLSGDLKHVDLKKINQDPVKYIGKKIEMTEKEFEVLKALYDAEITYLDFRISQLLDQFKKSNILDDTLVIITADHGENIGHYGLMGHEFSLSERILKIPLIFRLPSKFPRNRVSAPVQLVDIFPTIADLLEESDANLKAQFQGKSLLPQNWEQLNNRFTISELFRPNKDVVARRYPHLDITQFLKDMRAIRHQNYKFVWSSDGAHQLYNLEEDPAENENLIKDKKAKAEELENTLQEFLKGFQLMHTEFEEVELSSRTQERLRALGYID